MLGRALITTSFEQGENILDPAAQVRTKESDVIQLFQSLSLPSNGAGNLIS